MKKALSLILALLLCLSLCACGGNNASESPYEKYAKYEELFMYLETNDYDNANAYIQNFFGMTEDALTGEQAEPSTEAITTATPLTAEQQLVADAVNEVLQSEDFAAWQSLYKEFMGEDPKAPAITNVTRLQCGSFDGEKVDCYLINISADVVYWVNEEAEEGAVEEQFQIFVDTNTKAVYNSITADLANYNGDTSTAENRATYLLWVYNGIQLGNSNGFIISEMEITTELTEADIAVISTALTK